MESLFTKNVDFNADVYRNIVSLKTSQNLFSDLIDENVEDRENTSAIAIAAEARVKAEIPTGMINRGFHYNAAISYPFETQPFMSSRFSDGSFPVWYGSLETETTIYETAYHMIQEISKIDGVNEKIIRERALYTVHGEAILLDFRGKEKEYPGLVADHYDFTHAVAARLNREKHPGLLTPSARVYGNNIVVFNREILSNAKIVCYFSYSLNPKEKQVTITDGANKNLFTLKVENEKIYTQSV